MLILTRRVGEKILMNQGSIVIKVLAEKNGTIALGIQAPINMDIDRNEVFLQKKLRAKTSFKLPHPRLEA